MKKFLLFSMLTLLASCADVVKEGMIGLRYNSWDGKLEDTPLAPGRHYSVLTDVKVIDGTEITCPLPQLQPTDKDDVKFKSVKISAIYKVSPMGAIKFVRQTQEIDCIKSGNDPECDYFLGYNIVKSKLESATIAVFKKHGSIYIANNRKEIEIEVLKELQILLDIHYPEVFKITQIVLGELLNGEDLEARLQQQALIETDKKLMQGKQELLIMQGNVMQQELMAFKKAGSAVGLSLTEILKYRTEIERVKALQEIAKGEPKVQVQVQDK